MIHLLDALRLAQTKLRSRRLMLALTVTVSGLLFGIIIGTSLVTVGLSTSAAIYAKQALGGNYLVKATAVVPSSVFSATNDKLSQPTIDHLRALQTNYIARQKALAKQFGTTFDELTMAQILIPDPYFTSSKSLIINRNSPVLQIYLNELMENYAKTADNKLSDLQKLGDRYHALSYHRSQSANVNFTSLDYLSGNTEDLAKIGTSARPANSDLSLYGYLVASVQNSQYTFTDDSLISRFILPAASRLTVAGAVPVIITDKEAVQLFGKQLRIPNKPSDTAKQVAWMRNLQAKMNGLTYTACYRNQAEISLLDQAVQTATSIETNNGNHDYIKPNLVYAVPTGICSPVIVASDTRTTAEKQLAERQMNINRSDGTYEEPLAKLLTFQVIGVMPVTPNNQVRDISDFVTSLLNAQYGAGAIIPRQLYEKIPAIDRPDNILLSNSENNAGQQALQAAGIGENIVEFKKLADAKTFMSHGCADQTDCDKPFIFETYGSNYLLVDSLHQTAATIQSLTLPIALVIAGIIIWAMMTRVIIDNRRETAIFRAIGAKRRDIVVIYLIYVLNIATRIVVFAALVGCLIAVTVQVIYGNVATDFARVSYGVYGQGAAFNFVGVDLKSLMSIAGCIFGLALVAIAPPLVRNVRRNPIDDMRQE